MKKTKMELAEIASRAAWETAYAAFQAAVIESDNCDRAACKAATAVFDINDAWAAATEAHNTALKRLSAAKKAKSK